MIREAREEDRNIYLKMAYDFYHSPGVLHSIPESFIENTFNECMERDTYAQIYILESEGVIAGYGLVTKTFSQEAGGFAYWLEELYILDEFRSKGLGSEFFAYVEEHKGAGVMRFRLEVEPDNIRAAALYERLGYKNLPYSQMVKDFEV